MGIRQFLKPGPVDWTAKIRDLEAQVAETERELAVARTKRRDAAGNLAVYGGDPKPLAALEDQERELERKLDGLRAGVELARLELEKEREAERQGKLEELRRRREEIGAEILKRASSVDARCTQTAEDLQTIDRLLRDFANAGGGHSGQPLKTLATRSMISSGMREFFDRQCLAGPHCRPLAEQLRGVLSVSPAPVVVENPTEAETPARISA